MEAQVEFLDRVDEGYMSTWVEIEELAQTNTGGN